MEQTSGRISKVAFIGSSSALLVVCLIVVFCRCYIRFRIQKEFGWDDAFLMFGLCSLIVGLLLLFTVIDTMYESEDFVIGACIANITPTDISSLIIRIAHYRTFSAVALMLMWLSVGCVKICFLVFFRKLIRQKPVLEIFWLVTLMFNVAVIIYGIATCFVLCPYFGPDKVIQSMQCVQGTALNVALSFSTSQMALDYAGDVLILVIPIVLIWQIRVTWTQNLALSFTLCLTLVMVVIALARIAGLKWNGGLDSVWQTYFIVIAAEIGLSLVSVSAFRALYVIKSKDRHVNKTITSFRWYNHGGTAIWRAVTKNVGKSPSHDIERAKIEGDTPQRGFPPGTMTGIGTFINVNGRTRSQEIMDEGREDEHCHWERV